jgi:hypothetical protein
MNYYNFTLTIGLIAAWSPYGLLIYLAIPNLNGDWASRVWEHTVQPRKEWSRENPNKLAHFKTLLRTIHKEVRDES